VAQTSGALQATTIACEETPGQITISVSGAQAANEQNYYVVEIPEQGQTTVTITGSGQAPCPTDADKCTCQHNTDKLTPEKDGDLKFTFSPMGAGNQDTNNGPKVTWNVSSSTSPGEYKFKVTKIEQAYKDCPQGWSGGVNAKSNTLASDEITIIAFKIDLKDITIAGVGSQPVYKAAGKVILAGKQAEVRGKATIAPSSAATQAASKIELRLVQNIKGTQSGALIVPPPNGYEVQSSNYVADITLNGITAVAGTGGELTGPIYFDTPNVKVTDDNSYDVMYMNVELRVFLQYSFAGGDWKTVGVRDWTSSGTAVNNTSSGWTGSASSAAPGHASGSSLVPVTSGTPWNSLPKTTY